MRKTHLPKCARILIPWKCKLVISVVGKRSSKPVTLRKWSSIEHRHDLRGSRDKMWVDVKFIYQIFFALHKLLDSSPRTLHRSNVQNGNSGDSSAGVMWLWLWNCRYSGFYVCPDDTLSPTEGLSRGVRSGQRFFYFKISKPYRKLLAARPAPTSKKSLSLHFWRLLFYKSRIECISPPRSRIRSIWSLSLRKYSKQLTGITF